ncbi:MAG TPA: TIG domain-containing protein [Pyrinomonadaceae bacterium]
MELVDLNKPGERKKLIGAAVLGFVAILFLWWTFVGFGSSSSTPARTTTTTTTTQPQQVGARNQKPAVDAQAPAQIINISDLILPPRSGNVPVVPEPRRNIFAYYEKPVAPVKVETATPTPTPPPPPPPVLVAAISPSNVYAKTAEFTIEVSGDKFTPEMRVYVDERELQSKYKSPQQMSATVPAAIIASPGIRQIKIRTPDSRAYSNQLGLSVAPPPTPNYAYVGIWGTKHYVNTALLQDKNNKEILSVQLGDLLGGRFRVTSISDKEVVFTDTNLKIKHSLPMTEGERVAGAPGARPTPRVDSEDDEP